MNTENQEPKDAAADAVPEYDALVAQARSALAAAPELSPNQWAELRAGIDQDIQHQSREGVGWAWAAVAVASAAALLLSLRPAITIEATEPAEPVTAAAVVTPPVSQVAQAPVRAAAAPAVKPVAIQPGQLLAAKQASKAFEAFERHRLSLDAGGAMKVVAWSPRDLAVRLVSGTVNADIAKAFPGERIEIRTANAVVRVVGTQFSVTAEAAGATQVVVTEGIVDVYTGPDMSGAPARVTAGKTHRVEVAQEKPAKVAAPAARKTPKRVRSKAPAKLNEGGFRLIEIDVPPQQAPNAR